MMLFRRILSFSRTFTPLKFFHFGDVSLLLPSHKPEEKKTRIHLDGGVTINPTTSTDRTVEFYGGIECSTMAKLRCPPKQSSEWLLRVSSFAVKSLRGLTNALSKVLCCLMWKIGYQSINQSRYQQQRRSKSDEIRLLRR